MILVIMSAALILQAQAIAPDCSSCHKVRHGDGQCLNCHWNASTVSGKHLQKPSVPSSVHGGFDWEGDDAADINLPPEQEGCPACHANLIEHTSPVFNTCTGCHVDGRYNVASTLLLRDNITVLTPRVYSHYFNISQNRTAKDRDISCFGWSDSGEGSCHGVSFAYRNRSGGYFAFNLNYTNASVRSDIYHWTSTVDNLPPSGDCLFCHRQQDDAIRKAWGSPEILPADSSHADAKNGDCSGCHVQGERKSFHGKEIVRKKSSFMIEIIIILILISLAVIMYRRKQRRFIG